MLCVYSHLIIFHELYGFGVSMELWLRGYSVFSIQCICMSKDNLNHPEIKVNLDHDTMKKKNMVQSKLARFFFSETFLFLKKMDEITFFQFHLAKYNGAVLPNYFTQK